MENTDTDKQTGVELLKAVYEQHWLHARHVENERLWFTNIFGVVVAGLLAVTFTVKEQEIAQAFARYVGYVILALSLVGYFLCVTWRPPFVEHTTLANRLLKNLGLEEYVPYTSKAYRKIKVGWISAHELFLYFYSTIASAGLFLALCQQIKPLVCPYWWASVILFLALGSLWRGLLRRREVQYRKDMGVPEL